MKEKTTAENELKKMIITIDGPAGSGKSTTAKILADRLHLNYLDTGAMYRAVTLAVLREGIDINDEVRVAELLERITLEFRKVNGRSHIFLNGRDVEFEIRGKEVSELVSPVSKISSVRRKLVRLQRTVAADGGIVAEGRDTGTVVFPFAQLKVFLRADIETRGRRRLDQLKRMGIEADLNEIIENIRKRDEIDSSREMSPLVKPFGSIDIDTSKLTIEEQVKKIEEAARIEAEHIAALRVVKGAKDPFSAMRLYYRISHFFVRWFFKIVFGLKISGSENMKYKENFLFASNHISYGDPPVVGSALNREVSFLAKKELFVNPVFGWLITKYHAIPVDRDEADMKALKLILSKLKSGESVLMFPEGTRSRNGHLGELKGGVGFIAYNAKVTIVPVFIGNSNRLFRCFLRRARLEVKIGPPIRINKQYIPRNKKEAYTICSNMLKNEWRMLRDG